jgi:DNA-binding CsgD family transcriptional regulator
MMTAGAAGEVTPKRLLGRRREQAAIGNLLQAARDGEGGVLVLHGDPGVGKTALLDDTVHAAEGYRTVSAVGLEGEMEFPFAALQQLCAPILHFDVHLPDLQRNALSVAFGVSAGTAPDAFLIGLATLGLLSETAETQPLLCIIDDAQWLDSASAKALTFAARRASAERIAFLFAARTLDEGLAALPALQLGPLAHGDARNLMRSVIPGPLDERILERLVVETHGNPLAVIEFPRGLAPSQLAGGFGLPTALPLTKQIEQTFTRRLAHLSPDAKQLLLLASADPSGDPVLLSHAAQKMGIAQAAGQLLETHGLLEIGTGVAFRHPLARSAVYAAAGPQERRDSHRALAEAVNPALDPDRHAWHRAQAAIAPDDAVAEELERSAARARSRGGIAAGAAFLERAAALSSDPADRAKRALAAAKAKYEAGFLQEALQLIASVEDTEADERQHALAELLKGQVTLAARRGGEASPTLLRAARTLEPTDPQLARETYVEALSSALFAGSLAGTPSLIEVSEAALASPAPAVTGATDLLVEGIALWFTDSYAAGAPLLKQALAAFLDDTSPQPLAALRLSMATWAAAELWDEEAWIRLAEEQLSRARASGELTAVPSALGNRSIIHAMCGEFATAAALVEEQEAIEDAAGMAPTANGALWLPAWAGQETELQAMARVVSSDASARREGYALGVIGLVSAVLYNGLGRYPEATAAVRTAPEDAHRLAAPIAAVVELVEAATLGGDRPLAERALRQLLERTEAAQSTWALATAARSTALLAEPEQQDALYQEAIDRSSTTRLRVDLARTQLLYGEALRRRGRRADARTQLRSAHSLLTELGTAAFADRARRELHAAGGRAENKPVGNREPVNDLTPKETRIARLAADGHTNREIAAQLFISPSTVEYHLRKSFRKLDVQSRTQLATKLLQSTASTQAAQPSEAD